MNKKTLTILLTLLLGATAATGFAGGPIIDPYKFGSATPTPTPTDTTPPTLVSAVVDVSRTVLTLVFSEAVTADDWSKANFPMQDYVTEYKSGDLVNTITYSVVNGPLRPTDIEYLSFDGVGDVHDLAGNSLLPFSDFPVTNNAK